MEEQFIPLNLAKSLKELGFKEQCLGVYLNNHLEIINVKIFNTTSIKIVEAPLWQQAFDFFIKRYNLSGEIYCWRKEWHFDVERTDMGYQVFTNMSLTYKTQSDAQLACLEKLIKLVEEKKINED